MNIKRRLVPAWEDDFYRRFPLLFADALTHSLARSPLTEWGIECGIGWRRLLEEVCGKLERLIAEAPAELRAGYRVTQVKQKFGSLRIYMRRYTEEMFQVIGSAEEASLDLCEGCGAVTAVCRCSKEGS